MIMIIIGSEYMCRSIPKLTDLNVGSSVIRPLMDYHYSDFIINAMASQITNISTVCSVFCSGAHQRGHQSSPLLAFVRGTHWWPVDSPHKGPVTREMFPFNTSSCNFILEPYTMYQWCSDQASLTTVYSTVYSGADQRKHQSSASLAFVWVLVNSPHKGSVTRKMLPFDDVIMSSSSNLCQQMTVYLE